MTDGEIGVSIEPWNGGLKVSGNWPNAPTYYTTDPEQAERIAHELAGAKA
jgi:hypothetical protein